MNQGLLACFTCGGEDSACGFMLMWAYVEVRVFAFDYSIRDFFECQKHVEQCWFPAFFAQPIFEAQKLCSFHRVGLRCR
jgi:hypothetical protein